MVVVTRPLIRSEMALAAIVYRASFDERLPSLSGLHTPDEDRVFFETVVFGECSVRGAFSEDELVGVMALRDRWIDQLYVLPEMQGQGIGRQLLRIAQTEQSELSLWTFQRNQLARRFYERNGFVAVEHTDGSANEEREPDVRYYWEKVRGT